MISATSGVTTAISLPVRSPNLARTAAAREWGAACAPSASAVSKAGPGAGAARSYSAATSTAVPDGPDGPDGPPTVTGTRVSSPKSSPSTPTPLIGPNMVRWKTHSMYTAASTMPMVAITAQPG